LQQDTEIDLCVCVCLVEVNVFLEAVWALVIHRAT